MVFTSIVEGVGRCSKQGHCRASANEALAKESSSLTTWNPSIDCFHRLLRFRQRQPQLPGDSLQVKHFRSINPCYPVLLRFSSFFVSQRPMPIALCSLQKLTKLDHSSNDHAGPTPSFFARSLSFVDLNQNRPRDPYQNMFSRMLLMNPKQARRDVTISGKKVSCPQGYRPFGGRVFNPNQYRELNLDWIDLGK